VLAGGVATAMLRHTDPVADASDVPPDGKGKVQPWIDRLNAREEEYRILLAEIKRLRSSERELVVLRRKLQEKEQEIAQLVDKLTELTSPPPKGTTAKTKPKPSQSFLVTSAVSQAETDLEGCFVEWNEREKGDVDMTVSLKVTPDGVGHSSAATGPDSPFLRLCVGEALERVKYPPGPDELELEVSVQWSAGLLNQAPRIVQRRHSPNNLQDL
jgi:hypothetical protein